MDQHDRHSVLGVKINAVEYDDAVERVMSAAREGRPYSVSAMAVHGVMTGFLDEAHRQRLNDFDLLAPDGQPVRWALNWLHATRLKERVYGPELMLRVCQRAAKERLPIFLFGGTDELLDGLQERLYQRINGLQIAGVLASKFRQISAEERDEVARTIHESGAAMTFVGLGCPRQEVWVYEYRNHLSMPLLAVGAAFNFHAGLLPQAPAGLQKKGLEWSYRLWQEPRRLWKRYLLLNPLFLAMLGLQFAGVRRFEGDSAPRPIEELRYG